MREICFVISRENFFLLALNELFFDDENVGKNPLRRMKNSKISCGKIPTARH
jgi:hypothetical protein